MSFSCFQKVDRYDHMLVIQSQLHFESFILYYTNWAHNQVISFHHGYHASFKKTFQVKPLNFPSILTPKLALSYWSNTYIIFKYCLLRRSCSFLFLLWLFLLRLRNVGENICVICEQIFIFRHCLFLLCLGRSWAGWYSFSLQTIQRRLNQPWHDKTCL